MRGDERDFSCTCKGYEMQQARDGYCKHIHLARKSYCGWKQYHNGGEPIHRPYDGGVESFCPKCELFAYLSPYAPLVDKELMFICPSCGDTDKVRPATVNQSMQCTFPVVNPAECDGRALSVKVEMLLPLKADLKCTKCSYSGDYPSFLDERCPRCKNEALQGEHMCRICANDAIGEIKEALKDMAGDSDLLIAAIHAALDGSTEEE